MTDIYPPSGDSFFFSNFLEKYLSIADKNIKYLDMGCGSGVLSETTSKFLDKKNILAVDINPDAVAFVKQKNFNTVQSDLFKNIHDKFDLITFNAPYLPLDNREPKSSQIATTGGKHGDEITVKFLKQAKRYLNKNGKIFLLISSLTPTNKIKKFNGKIVSRKKIFFEELQIWEFN